MARGWMRERSVPSRILEILELEGPLTVHQLLAEFEMRGWEVNINTMRRAGARLQDFGRITTQLVESADLTGSRKTGAFREELLYIPQEGGNDGDTSADHVQ